jgi:hypothetical protein
VLPLPEELRDLVDWRRMRWVSGTPEAAALHDWFQRHRSQLAWNDEEMRFVLLAD